MTESLNEGNKVLNDKEENDEAFLREKCKANNKKGREEKEILCYILIRFSQFLSLHTDLELDALAGI